MRTGKIKVTAIDHGGPGVMRGQDVQVSVEIDGKMVGLRCKNLTLRVADRKAIATVDLVVDEVHVDGVLLHKLTKEETVLASSE